MQPQEVPENMVEVTLPDLMKPSADALKMPRSVIPPGADLGLEGDQSLAIDDLSRQLVVPKQADRLYGAREPIL